MNNAAVSKKMFPAALILQGRRCLVVGGGRVALRKTEKLSEAGAQLTVVAPEIRPPIKALPGVTCLERPFSPADIDGAFLVFALTDDSVVNRQVLDLCHARQILCSAADSNWPDGDLILPASFSAEGLTVSVSTSGRSCRRSRLLRESLSRHVRFLRDVDLLMIGADHQSATFQSLEQLKTVRPELEALLPCIWGVHEFMILDTCNRFEIVALLSAGSVEAVVTLLRKTSGTSAIHCVHGMAAFSRLAETAAGLHAQAFGENRIVAQIKEALATAQEKGYAGSFLQSWTDTALHISKEIRQAAGASPALETEDLVFQWLEKNRPSPGSVLIVGRGEIGQGLARRFPGAVQLSGRSDEELCRHLPQAELVLCATGSSTFLLGEAHRPFLRPGAVLMDLSLPRNINPALPGAIGLSDLRAAGLPENAQSVRAAAAQIAEAHREEYERLVNFR
jgi:siroheme synthase-like protein